jgi:fatty acid desaturase
MAPPVWTLYGKRYDLAAFRAVHPGGELALLLGADRDATSLFEAYHLSDGVAKRRLATLTPLPDPADAGSSAPSKLPAAAAAGAFHAELLAAARALPGGTKMSAPHAALCAVLGLATGACWVGWAAGSVPAMLVLPLIAWLLCANTAHDAAHFAVSRMPGINRLVALVACPLFYNTSVWYLQHDASHHVHTNEVGKDMDLHHMAPFVRLHGDEPHSAWHSVQVPFVAFGLWLATITQGAVYPLMVVLGVGIGDKGWGPPQHIARATRAELWLELAVVLSTLIYPSWAWGLSWRSAAFSAYPHLLASAVFMLFTQVAHVQAVVQGETRVYRHWSHAQVDAALDYDTGSSLAAFLSGGLNMQSLHHCLPSLSSSRLRELYPTYRTLCAKHGIALHEAPSLWAAASSHWAHLGHLSKNKAV